MRQLDFTHNQPSQIGHKIDQQRIFVAVSSNNSIKCQKKLVYFKSLTSSIQSVGIQSACSVGLDKLWGHETVGQHVVHISCSVCGFSNVSYVKIPQVQAIFKIMTLTLITTDFVRTVTIHNKISEVKNMRQLVFSIQNLPLFMLQTKCRICAIASKLLETYYRKTNRYCIHFVIFLNVIRGI